MTVQEAQTTSIRDKLIGFDVEEALYAVVEVWNFSRVKVHQFECEAVQVPELTVDVSNGSL